MEPCTIRDYRDFCEINSRLIAARPAKFPSWASRLVLERFRPAGSFSSMARPVMVEAINGWGKPRPRGVSYEELRDAG
jgi:hypothetical protein